jgi:hypothetical protein
LLTQAEAGAPQQSHRYVLLPSLPESGNGRTRIATCPLFSRSARMERFLRYAVDLALSGRGEDLKEHRLGVDVFDRARLRPLRSGLRRA